MHYSYLYLYLQCINEEFIRLYNSFVLDYYILELFLYNDSSSFSSKLLGKKRMINTKKQMKKKYLRVFFIITFLFLFSTVDAQVTIGSETPPGIGSLLDLKEKADGTSTRGLGMPRVAITNLTDIKVNIPSVLAGEESAHTGLMVYNINENWCLKTPITKGLYVWDGSMWENLLSQESREVTTYKDQDGNNFRARRFGNAGIWMIENLAAKTYASGVGGGNIPVHTGGQNLTAEVRGYPQPTSSSTTDWGAVPPTWEKKHGLLYSWPAAAKGNTSDVDQGQGTVGENIGEIIQGACPDGWHLPSDREWNELEKEIYNNAGTYSSSSTSSFNPISWNPAWENTVGQRGSSSTTGHSPAMRSTCPPSGSSYPTNGTSKPGPQGGFDIILTGYVDNNTINSYGSSTYIWASSSSTGGNGYNRNMFRNTITVQRAPIRRFYLCPVRCKKN